MKESHPNMSSMVTTITPEKIIYADELIEKVSEVAEPLIAKYKEVYKATQGETNELTKKIHEKVKQSYWDHLHDYITAEFAKGNYYKALKSAILETGLELKKHFPVEGENPNQLPNEITFS
jgi:hypothetical protein